MDANQSATSESIEPVKERIVSVDVLRGFDMFWIVGGGVLFASLFKLMGGPFERIFVPQLDHAEWQGFHFYDLIFPLFAFIVGMSVVFSLEKLLKDADILTIHIDGRASNNHFINHHTFSQMNPRILFLNASRGMVVDPVAAADFFTNQIGRASCRERV